MTRPPGLRAYLSLGLLGTLAARRRLADELARGGAEAARLAERMGQPSLRRPDGRLVWLHASSSDRHRALCDLARRIVEAHDDASVLLTGDDDFTATLPARILHQYVPNDAAGPVRSFLDHWRPDIAIWAGTGLRPALIDEAARRGIPIDLIDAAAAPAPDRGWRRLARLNAATLGHFRRVLATDDGAAAELIAAGADAACVEIAGPLDEEFATPPCNNLERDAIAATLKARPVWLAVAVPPEEESAVVSAHRSAARMAHRLLLILVPSDPARGPALAEMLSAVGFAVALRSVEGEPSAGTEIFVADSDGDLGLWYRLAPVSFMGGTLLPGGSGGRSPLEPASLGSAILHGVHTGPQAPVYNRFWSAEAARAVKDAAELGEALSQLLSPDRAAALAHAAWRVSTGGADTSERVLALVSQALDSGIGAG